MTIYKAALGVLSSKVIYPLTERYEQRDVRSKTRWIKEELALPAATRRARAEERLIALVSFCAARVPYYRDLFSQISFDPQNLHKDIKYLEDIPYLTKDIIREQQSRLIRDDHEGARVHLCKTGGSTGPSADIFYDQEAADWSSAVTSEARAQVGSPHWRSKLHFASKFPDVFPLKDRVREWVKCLAMNRSNLFFSTFSDDELEAIWKKMKAVRPHMAHSHPSTMEQIAAHVETTRGHDKAFEIFESSGELLSKGQRERIERILKCNVVNRYGLAEAGVVAYQTDVFSTDMQFFEFFAWPEIYEAESSTFDEAIEEGKVGELVITPLFNQHMPLLRYRTGDDAVLAERVDGFFIPQMVGRIHDVITLDGQPLATHYIQDVLDRVGGIREFQIERREGKPVFRIVPEQGADTAMIQQRLSEWWGDDATTEFVKLSELKLVGRRQKFRHLISEESDL